MREFSLTRFAVILTAMSAPIEASGAFSILYFAAAATFTGKTAEQLPAPLRVRDLFAKLNDKYPGIHEKVLSSCALTVNLEYVDLEDDNAGADQEIKVGDEVAIIPPVSSG